LMLSLVSRPFKASKRQIARGSRTTWRFEASNPKVS
jgi:hypothetical protein